MKVLFLLEGTTVPASRFRVLQLLDAFREIGIEPTVRYAYGDDYNRTLRTPLARPYQLATRLRRAAVGLDAGRFDAVFLQRPALPFSAIPERLVHLLNHRTIFDVDDSIFVGGDGAVSPLRLKGFQQTVQTVGHVITGNRWLAQQAGVEHKTTVIPTVVDDTRYVPATASSRGAPVIGWMGTMGNFPFLRQVLPDLRMVLDRNPGVRVRLVSNATLSDVEGDARFEQVPWSAEAEVSLLQGFDIGLMPLPDSISTRGKCAFKMIQYMAVGRPVVVSAVGANVETFGDGQPGFLVPAGASWVEPLQHLLDDASLRKRCGEVGRERVESHYCIRAVMPSYQSVFAKQMAGLSANS
jgi:glycosyltransferase involved in cell wall biosynthesis